MQKGFHLYKLPLEFSLILFLNLLINRNLTEILAGIMAVQCSCWNYVIPTLAKQHKNKSCKGVGHNDPRSQELLKCCRWCFWMMVAPLCRNINQSLKWSNFGRRAALLRNAVGIKTTVWVRVMQGRVHTRANAPFKVIMQLTVRWKDTTVLWTETSYSTTRLHCS